MIPTITVLMPAYNAAKYIGEAISSVLQQSFGDFELLIINDGSADNTVEVINSFTDERIRIIHQTNQGVAAALNIGLLNAKAELIARFDADDICLPDRLEKQLEFFLSHPAHVLVGSDADYVDMNGAFIYRQPFAAYDDESIRQLPASVCPFSHVTVLYKKEAAIKAGMYDINAHSFEDHLLWHKIMQLGRVAIIPEVLVRVRFNPESVTIDDTWRSRRFRKIKYASIGNGYISREKGDKLLKIIRQQNTGSIKKGAYYSLLAKKFLFNNYNQAGARFNIVQLIKTCPLKMQGYLLLGLSFFPERILKAIYKIK
ncbi:glycosyltransferase family 2 protein [Ferruginibacter sp.]